MLRLIRPLSFLRSPRYYPSYCYRNMASESTGPAPAGTHKDPVTGEMISKQSVIKFFFFLTFGERKKLIGLIDGCFFFFDLKGNSSVVKNKEPRMLPRLAKLLLQLQSLPQPPLLLLLQRPVKMISTQT